MKNKTNSKVIRGTENEYKEIELIIAFAGLFLLTIFLILSQITIISNFIIGVVTLGFGSAITIAFLQWTDIGVRINDRLFHLK